MQRGDRQIPKNTGPNGLLLAVALALPMALSATVPADPALGRARPGKPITGHVGPGAKSKWPPPLRTRYYLDATLRYERGKLIQRTLRKRRFRRSTVLKRYVGRFLAKLYQGTKLKDVIPFKFPLLAPVESFTYTGRGIARKMEANLKTGARIRLPYLSTINRIEITDVATGHRWALDLSPLRPRPSLRTAPRRTTPRAKP